MWNGERAVYDVAGFNCLIFLATVLVLPKDPRKVEPVTFQRLAHSIDWIGATVGSTSPGFLSYVFATVTASVTAIHAPANIVILCIAIALIPVFIAWVRRQEGLNRAAKILPSSFKTTQTSPHRARIFAPTSLSVFLAYGVLNIFSNFSSLFLQELQDLTPPSTSPRYLPMVLAGIATNMLTGFSTNCCQ